ncbi:MAG: class I SAM-dependent methyltransferase [Clostridia bacterium]|nr:class I SAM-dependent methyltransferase [Clostridia bacterium]MBR0205878.1 class I SAM-dependent methyltransferase [Clostridia bacterium]
MIDTRDVIEFFDRLASTWDAGMVRNEPVIARILDLAGVVPGTEALDVATGTGVLIPDYLSRGVVHVTAVDISPKMAQIAQGKFAGDDRVTILCADAQTMAFDRRFDCILIYNAFPHFSEPERLFDNLSRQLKLGGRLTVAHGMSRERINDHHRGGASHVSYGLMPARDLAALMAPFVAVDQVLSDDSMYLVSGINRQP